ELPGDDRDGTAVAALLLVATRAGGLPLVRDVRPGEERSLYRTSPWELLDERLRACEVALGVVRDDVIPFCAGWLERVAVPLLEAVEDADDASYGVLVDRLRTLVTREVLDAMDVEPRALVWIATERDRDELTAFVAARRFAGPFPTRIANGRVLADLAPLPPALSEVRPAESALVARVSRVLPDRVEITARIRHVEVDAAATATYDGEPADVVPQRDGWLVTVPDENVAELTLTVAGVSRSARVVDVDPHGSGVRWDGVEGADAGVTDVVVDGLSLRVTAAASGVGTLVGPELLTASGDGPWEFRLSSERWATGVRPAPTGGYRFEVDGRPVPVTDTLLDRLPDEIRTDDHRVTLRRGPVGGLVVRLDPPLADDELGPRSQARLQASYAQVSEPLDPRLVYLQSFQGSHVNDHPAAIQRELHRVRPDLIVRWAVADHSAPYPSGTTPVLIRSRDWYDVLARAAHVVTNVDLDRWFVRREGQQVLQTYHGYPSKRMGVDQWRARNFPPSRIAQDLARSSGTWTALLTPQPDANAYYREQYAYDGRILDLGYPRDDVLVTADGTRERTRDLLGAAGRKVLLYAPTWRDDLATNFRAARAEHHLDPVALTEGLGPDWLVLLRGHRFHAPSGSTGAAVLDVTSYPEVNDLILAADAAVLDYSSLRFDFAITGRPAVYLVPDLDRYTGRVRGFLQDYRDTAPGPLVNTTAEVAAELRDLDALADRWREPIATFNARFNALADGHASERVVAAFFADLPG
ncbi:MAG: hypothetical protein JWO46_556, partial [Nocardioidaceae bacterium]|nr:hypothetical protein [Nocardioidaceae bacterium]